MNAITKADLIKILGRHQADSQALTVKLLAELGFGDDEAEAEAETETPVAEGKALDAEQHWELKLNQEVAPCP